MDSSRKSVVEMHRKSKEHDSCYKNILAEGVAKGIKSWNTKSTININAIPTLSDSDVMFLQK